MSSHQLTSVGRIKEKLDNLEKYEGIVKISTDNRHYKSWQFKSKTEKGNKTEYKLVKGKHEIYIVYIDRVKEHKLELKDPLKEENEAIHNITFQ